MPDRDKGSNERRDMASEDEETKERVARKGGEASHGGRSSGGGQGGSSGGSRGGSKGSEGAHYDTEVDRCRDEQGQFTECDDDEKGGRSGSAGGSKGGQGGSKGSSSGGRSSSSSGSSKTSSGSRGRD